MTEPQIGRLVLRQEGEFWNAYYATPGTMDGALLLGSVHMRAVSHRDSRKSEFMLLMREVVSDFIEELCGERPVWSAFKPSRVKLEGDAL